MAHENVICYGGDAWEFKGIRHARKVRDTWCIDILTLPLVCRLALRKACDVRPLTYCDHDTFGKRAIHAANLFLFQFRKR
jgi:hypothetical protein